MSVISPLSRMEILLGSREHQQGCMRITKSLPEYFDETGLEQVRRSLSGDVLYVALENEQVVGFATVGDEKKGEAQITWLAVDPSWQGNGVGRSLVSRVEDDLAGRGVESLAVKTLAESVKYSPFEATRRFYRQNSFVCVDVIDPHPGWGGDAAAVYEKALHTGETEHGQNSTKSELERI